MADEKACGTIVFSNETGIGLTVSGGRIISELECPKQDFGASGRKARIRI